MSDPFKSSIVILSAYNLSMARKRTSKSQGGQPKKQKTDPDVKIRNSKSQKKLSSAHDRFYNNSEANYNLCQWVSTVD